ncbi:MAG: nucleoside triphosphate pyrophosphohydrolase [Candidatus Cloacimonetes bacterium]|nr:nucleoside triphosphate pyrophosphohydrolase [Candidatus Cloacimonadota bacterium]MCF7813977.1 nucleoside triphosphate pyrophosphohydrolase [Candidatus Cloacimonadota bacterium]MCF7868821.1 nucleoside triphosphate pyrophosphohydrolase [Candidatus Cloacimonadota bacterium]MCF7884080.1 nucleoside triphosphate pyrophosphohydrolase [Candidatus Cloacimonadota bacterium]
MKEFDKLVEIIEKLRDRENGCPWDIKQTHESLIPNFVEELYESIEAIENKNFDHLSEELGDLMLHIIMQAQIAGEAGQFEIAEVLQKINDKLIRRHPHVFADGHATDADGVKMNWERIKFQEKKKSRKSAIDGIPKAMPALIVAQRMQEKAASVGFDWPDVEPAVDKLKEEIHEFIDAFQQKDVEEMQDELGDMLFSIVNISRKLGFDTESALRRTIDKFDRRFRKVEEHYQKSDKNMLDASLEQLDEIWEIAKEDE